MVSTKMFDLSGRVAVVTGGIGRGIALGLGQAGCAVAVLARNEEKNQHLLHELVELGVPALRDGMNAQKIDLNLLAKALQWKTGQGTKDRYPSIVDQPEKPLLS